MSNHDVARNMRVHQNILYVFPFLYINEKDGAKGNTLLFIFFITRDKEESGKLNLIQEYIAFNSKDNMKSDIILTSYYESLKYPAVIERLETLAFKNNIYFIPKVVPVGFWDLDQAFIDKAINKLTSSAFSTIPDIAFTPFNTISLEAVLANNSLKDDAYGAIFHLYSEFGTIKYIRTQETKNK